MKEQSLTGKSLKKPGAGATPKNVKTNDGLISPQESKGGGYRKNSGGGKPYKTEYRAEDGQSP